jgi:hypothetical protein
MQVNFVDYMREANFPKMIHAIRRLTFLKIGCAHAYGRWHFGRLFVILCLFAGPAVAPGAEVSDLIINNSQGQLLLSLKIRDALTKEAREPETEEVSSTIVFSIALYRVHTFWFDKKVAHQTATNTLKYDPSKKEYSLMRSWDSGPPLVMENLNQARFLMSEIKDLKLMPLDGLEKGRNYQIRAQAVCQDRNAFIFGPSGCFKTDWYTVDFTF